MLGGERLARQKLGKAGKEIKSADEATQRAVDFLKPYYPWLKPMKATKANHIWVVEVDVGAFLTKIAKVHIDVKTGSIVEYDVPEVGTRSEE